MFGYILVALGVAIAAWLYLRASQRLDEREAEMWRQWRERERLRAENDHRFHVFEKQPLYDAEKDFE